MCSTDFPLPDESPHYWRFAIFCATVTVNCAGFFGNALTGYIFSRPQLRSSINILIAQLAFSDVCFSLFSTVTYFPYGVYYYDGNLTRYLPAQAYTIVYVFPLAMVVRTASVWILILITIERYLAVCHPFKARQLCTVRSAVGWFIGVVVAAVLYNLSRFWEYQFSLCSGIWTLKDWLRENPIYQRVYTMWSYLFFMYLIPFGTLAVFNGQIIIALHKARQFRSQIASKRCQVKANTVPRRRKKPFSPRRRKKPFSEVSSIYSSTKVVTRIALRNYAEDPKSDSNDTLQPIRKCSSFPNIVPPEAHQDFKRIYNDSLQTGSHPDLSEKKLRLYGRFVCKLTKSDKKKTDGRTTQMMLVVILIFITCNSLAFVLAVFEVAVYGSLANARSELFDVATDFSNFLVSVHSAVNIVVYYIYSSTYRMRLRLLCGYIEAPKNERNNNNDCKARIRNAPICEKVNFIR